MNFVFTCRAGVPGLVMACICLLVLPPSARAGLADDLVTKSRELHLAADPAWLALLHVNRGGTTRDRGHSYVDDPRFFFAPDGDEDSAAELEATLRALFAPDASFGDDSPRCRFIARFQWLAGRLGQPVPDLRASCPLYGAWVDPIRAGRLTLVFPGSYLNSPSSMFGHTLLRIDPPADAGSTEWLSYAVSFGAVVRPEDNSLLYVWKGLFGGYGGLFQIQRYFQQIQRYGRMENRDLWEYPLDLDPAEIALLVDHLWELRDVDFNYYFFDENCSYRLLELLEVARPSLSLTHEWRFAEAPVNTVRTLRASGVAAAPRLRPSAERELRVRIARLDEPERELARALAGDAVTPADPRFLALSRERQSAVLATAYAEVVYRARRKKGRDASRAKHSLALLAAVNERGLPTAIDVPAPPAPESGHRTHRFTLGGGVEDGSGRSQGFTTLGARVTYHDLLDPPRGYLPGATLELGDIEARIDEAGALRLERLDLAQVFSLSPRDRFFPSWSWRVRGGIEREPMEDLRPHASRFIEGGGGGAWQAGKVMARAFAELRVEHNGEHEHLVDAAIGPSFGLVGQHERLAWQLDWRPLSFAGGLARAEMRAAMQWHLGAAWGLRLDARWRGVADGGREREQSDAQIQLQHYY